MTAQVACQGTMTTPFRRSPSPRYSQNHQNSNFHNTTKIQKSPNVTFSSPSKSPSLSLSSTILHPMQPRQTTTYNLHKLGPNKSKKKKNNKNKTSNSQNPPPFIPRKKNFHLRRIGSTFLAGVHGRADPPHLKPTSTSFSSWAP